LSGVRFFVGAWMAYFSAHGCHIFLNGSKIRRMSFSRMFCWLNRKTDTSPVHSDSP